MRAEMIEEEAKNFNHPDEVYIHIEKTQKSPMFCFTCGSFDMVIHAIFMIMEKLCASTGISFKNIIKLVEQEKKFYDKNFDGLEINDMK